MTVTEPEALRVRGAVSMRDPDLMPYSVTWPFGLLRSTESRVSVSTSLSPGVWSNAWQELPVALVSRRTVTLVSGPRSRVRFTVFRQRTFDTILHEVRRHGVPIQPTCSLAWDLMMPLGQLLLVASWALVVLGLSVGLPGVLIGTLCVTLAIAFLVGRYRTLRAAADAAA